MSTKLAIRMIASLLTGCFISVSVYADNSVFNITSTSFPINGRIPKSFTCDGDNNSPQLSWSNAPINTQSFALILTSPDWSAGPSYFWIVYNIPSTMTSFPEGINKNMPDGLVNGINYYNESNYRGPCPPDGIPHHYVFAIYALDTKLDLPDGASIDDVLDKMSGHILKSASVVGVYSH